MTKITTLYDNIKEAIEDFIREDKNINPLGEDAFNRLILAKDFEIFGNSYHIIFEVFKN